MRNKQYKRKEVCSVERNQNPQHPGKTDNKDNTQTLAAEPMSAAGPSPENISPWLSAERGQLRELYGQTSGTSGKEVLSGTFLKKQDVIQNSILNLETM